LYTYIFYYKNLYTRNEAKQSDHIKTEAIYLLLNKAKVTRTCLECWHNLQKEDAVVAFEAALCRERDGAHEVCRRRQTYFGRGWLLVEHLLLAVLRPIHDLVLAPNKKYIF
jgi:hypothetical protein